LATDLRVALVSLGAFSSAVPSVKCHDQDKKTLAAAASYIAENPNPKIFTGDALLDRGLKFCDGSSS